MWVDAATPHLGDLRLRLVQLRHERVSRRADRDPFLAIVVAHRALGQSGVTAPDRLDVRVGDVVPVDVDV
jgi:hypothetical protein